MTETRTEASVVRLGDVLHYSCTREQIRQIFFETSGQRDFSCPEEREAYFWRWCGAYLTHQPDHCFVLTKEDQVRGYLVGCLDTARLRERFDRADDLDAFSAYWSDYPAHLHINLDVSHRRAGRGRQLVSMFLEECEEADCSGVHVITSAGAANRDFYEKCGFVLVARAFVRASELVFLGRKLRGG